jgi:hypothetical protein
LKTKALPGWGASDSLPRYRIRKQRQVVAKRGEDALDVIPTRQSGVDVEYLINNAGFGVFGYAIERDRAEQLNIIAANIRALTDLSLRFGAAASSTSVRSRGLSRTARYGGLLRLQILPMYGIARDVLKDPNYWADEPIGEDE